MTNMIAPGGGQPPPTPATKPTQPPTAGKGAEASGFLALLALLSPRAAEAPTDADPKATSHDATSTDLVASTVRHRGKHDGRDTDPAGDLSGVVRAHPILPAPVIMGAPPVAGTTRDWRTSDAPPTTTGVQGAHPILPDTLPDQRIGDVTPMRTAGPSSRPSPPALTGNSPTSDAPTTASTVTALPMPIGARPDGAATPTVALAASPGQAERPLLERIPTSAPGSAATATAAQPFTSTLPMAAAQGVQQPLPASVQATAALTTAAPSAVLPSATTKRRGTDPDGTASVSGAFALTDARLGSVSTMGGLPAAAPTHPAVVNATREIVAQAQLVGNGQATEMRLRLRPPDLGEVGVTIRRTAAGALTVHLAPASPEAAAVLRTHLPHLQTALEPHSHGQGAQVTLGQHDASGSSHRQGNSDPGRGDAEGFLAPATSTDAAIPRSPTRITRSAAIDYDA